MKIFFNSSPLRRSNQKLRHYSANKIICWFFRHSRAANFAVSGGIRLKFKVIQDFMGFLVTCKNEEDPKQNEGTRVLTKLYVDFSDTQGQLTPQSELESG